MRAAALRPAELEELLAAAQLALLHVGTAREEGGVTHESIIAPSSCPSGKFAWAADAAFNGGAPERVGATETSCSGTEEPPVKEVPKHEEPPASTTGSTTRPSENGSRASGPSSVSIVACMPPELFEPGGTFGLPDELQPATSASVLRSTRNRRWRIE